MYVYKYINAGRIIKKNKKKTWKISNIKGTTEFPKLKCIKFITLNVNYRQ